MQDFIVDMLTAGLRLFNTTREKLAADVREIANRIENRELIADEAFSRAEATRDATASARDKLPD